MGILFFVIGIFNLFRSYTNSKGHSKNNFLSQNILMVYISKIVGFIFTIVGYRMLSATVNDVFANLIYSNSSLGRNIFVITVISIVATLLIISYNIFNTSEYTKTNNRRKNKYNHAASSKKLIASLPYITITILSLVLVTINYLKLTVQNEIRINDITSQGRSNSIKKVLMKEEKTYFKNNSLEVLAQYNIDSDGISNPVINNDKLYIFTEKEELNIFNINDGSLIKSIRTKPSRWSLSSSNSPIVYNDKYYIFISQNGFAASDYKLNVLEIETGKLVFENKFRRIDNYLFEIYNQYLIFTEGGVIVYRLNLNTMELESLYQLISKEELYSTRLYNQGKDTAIVDGKVYLFLEDYDDKKIDVLTGDITPPDQQIHTLFNNYIKGVSPNNRKIKTDSQGIIIDQTVDNKFLLHIDEEHTYFEEYIDKDDETTEYKLSVVDSKEFTEIWSKVFKEPIQYSTSSTNYVMVYLESGKVYLYDKITGLELEKFSFKNIEGVYKANLVSNEKRFVLIDDKGELIVFSEKN